MPNSEDSLQITKEELGRQAVHSLRGYIYQLYQSLAGWLELRSDERLLLEVTEDYAKLSDNIVQRTQVGETKASGNITLKSEKVISLIESHWNMQNANPAKKVMSTLLTTSGIGKEQHCQLPDGMSGLDYWKIAAREGADVEPIRAILLQANFSQPLKDWIANTSAAELRDRIIAPIKWVCHSEQLGVLQDSIRESLANLGETYGISPTNASATLDSLLGEVVQRVLLEQDQRVLKRSDLLFAFEDATRISVPAEQYVRHAAQFMPANMVGQTGLDLEASTVRQMPKTPRLASRSQYVDALWQQSAKLGFLWISGSNGLGKTLLARLVAERSDSDWLFVNLRDCDAQTVRSTLYSARQSIRGGAFGGIILDDYPGEQLLKTKHNLALLCFEAERRNIRVIVTGNRPATAEVLSSLGKTATSSIEVPYLAVEDVAEIVDKAGGDPGIWSKAIHAFCGMGHPMLVDARVQGLSLRGWPIDELAAEFYPPFQGSMEIQAQRDTILLRLTNELPQNVRDLLFRLCICTQFDRAMVKAIAAADPAIPRAVEAFTLLLGPWIEARGNDNYSVSPLVSKIGSDNLGNKEQIAVRTALIESLTGRNPFPGEQVLQLFLNAYIISHVSGLFWFVMLVAMTASSGRRRSFRLLAQHLSPMVLLTTERDLFLPDKTLSFMLRVAQSLVAAGAGEDNASKIFERLIAEYEASEKDAVHSGMYLLCITFSLLERNHVLPSRVWLKLVSDYDSLTQRCIELGFGDELNALEAKKDLPVSTSQFLCTVQASSMKSIDELTQLMDQLDGLPANTRNYFIDGLSDAFDSRRRMVDSAWLSESKAGTLNALIAAEKYAHLAKMASGWGRSDLEIDCLCAQILVLDEYGGDAEQAQKLVDFGLQKYPGHERLLRRKQFILYRQLKHDQALEVFSELHRQYRTLHNIDITFALRDAGVSAGQVKNFQLAKEYFSEAASVAREKDSRSHMVAGFLADAAVCAYELSNYSEAIEFAKEALNLAENMDPTTSAEAKYCHASLANLVSWMLDRSGDNKPKFELWPGCCSVPEPEMDSSKPIFASAGICRWYMLAAVEIQLGLEPKLWRALRDKGSTEASLVQLPLSLQFMANACKRVNVEDFLMELPHYLALMQSALSAGLPTDVGSCSSILSLPPLPQEKWTDPMPWTYFRDAANSFAFCAMIELKDSVTSALCERLYAVEDVSPLAKFLETLRGGYNESDGVTSDLVVAQCAAICRDQGVSMNPETAYFITSQIWMWLRESAFRGILEDRLADFITTVWTRIINEAQFSLRSPQVVVPEIAAALQGDDHGLAKLGSLLLAARYATNWRLPESIVEQIAETGGY